MKQQLARALPVIALWFMTAAINPRASEAAGLAASSCAQAAQASFAWWVGSWSYAVAGYDPGVSTVTATDEGCKLQEEFVDRGGQKQHTTLEYDPARDVWLRLVVDPFRTYRSEGHFASDGSIAFYETPSDRETYRPVDRGHVHFIGEKSDDGGKSWRLLFEAVYTRKP